MTPFEIVTAILNLLALILIPIIAVIIGQHLQKVSAKRKDRTYTCIFQARPMDS